jgi:hypothetical protein
MEMYYVREYTSTCRLYSPLHIKLLFAPLRHFKDQIVFHCQDNLYYSLLHT